MKKITKQLTVSRLEMRHCMEGKYELGLRQPGAWSEAESTLTLTAQDMIRLGLDPGEDLAGATLELTLTAGPFSWETRSLDTVIITRLSRFTEVQHHYSFVPPDKSERRIWRLEAKTPVRGGTLIVLPPTYYELNLLLTEGEYRRLRALPAASALEVQLRHVRRHLRDVVLTYRGALDDHRVFPEEYAERMTALARAMIAYFDGDVDVVEHYCGLEVEEESQKADADSRLGTRTWHREYFAVDGFSPDDWERVFADSVARVDAILKDRYDNRLPMSTVHEFYDNLETSTWESKKWHPIQELSIGLQAKYVFRESWHLPSIVIEARSVNGNRKACQAACEALSQEAANLFGVRFDHVSLAVEEIRDKPEPPSPAAPQASISTEEQLR
jgi:hypothetical protein